MTKCGELNCDHQCEDGIIYCACHQHEMKDCINKAVEKEMDEYYIRIITAFRNERKIKEVVKERIEKEKKQKGRHGVMITIVPILEYIDALYFAESCARIARWQDARADEKSDECKSIIAAGSDSNQAKAATNPDREHSGNSSLSISEQQAVEKALKNAPLDAEKAAQYIRQNVVPASLREAITDCLAKPLPNIMHLCALSAGWTNKEMGQEEQIQQAVEKALEEQEKEIAAYYVHVNHQHCPRTKTWVPGHHQDCLAYEMRLIKAASLPQQTTRWPSAKTGAKKVGK